MSRLQIMIRDGGPTASKPFRKLTTEYPALPATMSYFIKTDKGDFEGACGSDGRKREAK